MEMMRAIRDLSESNRIAEKEMDLTRHPDDIGDADSEDREDSQSTIVIRIPRAAARNVKEEQGRSASTPPVLRLSRWVEGNVIIVDSTSGSSNTDGEKQEASV